jgi:hypothetical protein
MERDYIELEIVNLRINKEDMSDEEKESPAYQKVLQELGIQSNDDQILFTLDDLDTFPYLLDVDEIVGISPVLDQNSPYVQFEFRSGGRCFAKGEFTDVREMLRKIAHVWTL